MLALEHKINERQQVKERFLNRSLGVLDAIDEEPPEPAEEDSPSPNLYEASYLQLQEQLLQRQDNEIKVLERQINTAVNRCPSGIEYVADVSRVGETAVRCFGIDKGVFKELLARD